ncbi:MAG: hypothetical protein RQ885_07975 [Desulfurococcales archaeon]|jgi:biotin operon repressor|nr:hypothetical protein [Desulfurococcales archaeon]
MMSSVDPFMDHVVRKRIELFRELDSIIDFSKSSYQLDIVVFMGNIGKPVSIDAIVSALGVERKHILDAVRKLRLKGMVDSKGSFYILTDVGKRFYDILVRDLVASDPNTNNHDIAKLVRRFRGIALAIDVIRLIGMWGRPLKLYKVARSFGTNIADLLELLSPFIRDMGGEDIIRLIDCYEGFIRKRAVKCLTLSRQGIDIIRGMSEVKRYRVFYKLVGDITRSLTMDKIFEKLLIYMAINSIIMITLQRTAYAKIALVAGFTVIIFLVSLYIASIKISKIYRRIR